MPTTRQPCILTADDKKRLSAALTKRIGPSTMPHEYRHVKDPQRPCLFRVFDPETKSKLTASLTPGFRMQVIDFHAPHQN